VIRIAAAAGFVLFAATLWSGCSVLVSEKAPPDPIQISAPTLVEVDPYVDAAAPKPTRYLSPARARLVVRRAALEILVPSCDDDPKGRGIAVGPHTLVAHRDVIEGGGWVRVFAANRESTAVGPGSAYRVGDLAVTRVARAVPHALRAVRSVGSGASVVVVTERNGKFRMLPGVLVDGVPGSAYGVRTKVFRVTSDVREGDAGPVLDANGRVVAVLFGVDPKTTLGLALPVAALAGRGPARVLEALDSCD
jgi:hypothetical protein